MNRLARLPVVATVLVTLTVSLTGCDKLKARDQLNKGVASYKAGKYEEAVRHFQDATNLDPTLPSAKAYLATALSQDVVPGLTTPENLKTAQSAINIYQQVLDKNPNDINSLKGVASLYYNTKRLDQAKDYQKKVLASDPKDPEAAYWVGMIDWTEAHENLLKTLPAGMNDDGAGNAKLPKKDCQELQAKNGPLVEEGLKYLNSAIENRPNYDDAMSYLNLTYRRKADLDCGDDADRKADVAKANDWSAKAMGVRKANEAKKNQGPGGITMDSNGNMK
jgi:hypothetical protein